jgi:DNA repair photolyase
VPAGVLAAPMIPGLNDAELERILQAAAEAGATRAGYGLLRLPRELRAMFEEWLRQHRPLRADHVLALVRDTRGGELNDSRFGQRFSGTGAYAALLEQRFAVAARRLGLDVRRPPLEVRHFAVPPGEGRDRTPAASGQMSLF